MTEIDFFVNHWVKNGNFPNSVSCVLEDVKNGKGHDDEIYEVLVILHGILTDKSVRDEVMNHVDNQQAPSPGQLSFDDIA